MIREIAFAGALLMAGTSVQAQAQDAVAGGLLGAGAGAILGGALTGKAGGAVAGAMLGGATGAIIANENDRRRYRVERRGYYFTSRHRCFYEYPNGDVVRVANRPC
ncbi:glycine zipper domain-containing protein [Terrihabitans sp. B22-R8]|uniref:glycine zipper domain-containing protein n=1 Tax=Terrihabitans sp. B22-R8 TaxID=3425128 RepID=UPI00403D5095